MQCKSLASMQHAEVAPRTEAFSTCVDCHAWPRLALATDLGLAVDFTSCTEQRFAYIANHHNSGIGSTGSPP
jgi:hypothetical protein